MGVGSHLKEIIPALFEWSGCKCADLVAKYDAWGWRACQRRSDLIHGELMAQAMNNPKANWAPKSITMPIIKKWVRTAIERAKQDDQSRPHTQARKRL